MTQESAGVDHIPVPELPDHLKAEVNAAIRRHSVSMVVADADESNGRPCAGVLCTVEGLPGLLTARHVSDTFSRAKTLVLMLGPRHPYRIATNLLHPCAPAAMHVGPPFNARIPDVAFVPLAHEHKSAIEARHKVFYSIDRRRNDPTFDIYGDGGFWIAIGSPDALMRRESRAVSSLTYITDVQQKLRHDNWDYLVVNLNLESNAPIPANLEGMSGGGIWRAKFNVTADRLRFWVDDPSRDILLEGITFFQTELPGRQLIAHGPASVYECLPQLVRDSRAL